MYATRIGRVSSQSACYTCNTASIGLLVEAALPERLSEVTHVTFYWRNLNTTLTLSTGGCMTFVAPSCRPPLVPSPAICYCNTSA